MAKVLVFLQDFEEPIHGYSGKAGQRLNMRDDWADELLEKFPTAFGRESDYGKVTDLPARIDLAPDGTPAPIVESDDPVTHVAATKDIKEPKAKPSKAGTSATAKAKTKAK